MTWSNVFFTKIDVNGWFNETASVAAKSTKMPKEVRVHYSGLRVWQTFQHWCIENRVLICQPLPPHMTQYTMRRHDLSMLIQCNQRIERRLLRRHVQRKIFGYSSAEKSPTILDKKTGHQWRCGTTLLERDISVEWSNMRLTYFTVRSCTTKHVSGTNLPRR